MLLPSDKPLFENVSSNEYYARSGKLKDEGVDGIVHFVFPDFEEAIVFSGGRPVTGIHEAKRWLTISDGLVEAVENKAITVPGKMSAYRLDPALVQVFAHKDLKNMVETTLGKYLTPGLLIGYLEGEGSTSILKLNDDKATAYVFINNGKRAGAAYVSPEGRSNGESAVKDMARFKENTSAAIYFLESVIKPKAEKPAVEPVAHPAPAAAPAPVTAPVSSKAPEEKPEPAKAAPRKVKPVLVKPQPVPPVQKRQGIRLSVAMSADETPALRHRSRQQVLETLEESDVAWVDAKTLASLQILDRKASLVLPDGREYHVTLKEAPIEPVENRYIILPRKLRSKLSLVRGMTIEVKE